MNELFNFNVAIFNKFVETQSQVNQELISISKLVQDFFSKTGRSMDELKTTQNAVMEHSSKITNLLSSIQQEYLKSSQEYASLSINESQKLYKTLIDKFVEASKNSQDQYLKFLNTAFGQFNEAASNAKSKK